MLAYHLDRIGAANGLAFREHLDSRIFATDITIRRLFVGSRAQFEAMSRAIAFHRLHPVIDRVFAFAETMEAYKYYEARQRFGKIVIAE